MKNPIITYLLILLFTQSIVGQDSTQIDKGTWKRELATGLNLNQASFSKNWAAGGQNAISGMVFLNGKTELTKQRLNWRNDLQLQLGFAQITNDDLWGIEKSDNQQPSLTRKTQDRIFLDSKLAYQLKEQSDKWKLFYSLNYLTQFVQGFKYGGAPSGGDLKISDIKSPAFLTQSIGIEYNPFSYLSAQFGVGSFRQTFLFDEEVRNNTKDKNGTSYGVPDKKNVRNEAAFNMIINFDKNIAENVNLKARYAGFANYETMFKNEKNIDHRLDVIFTAKVNKFMNVTLNTIHIFDRDISERIQWSQSFSLGILYKFSEF